MAPAAARSARSEVQVVAPKEKETSMKKLGGRTISSSETSSSRGVKGISTEAEDGNLASSTTCCTPKAKRFKVPELLSCPPAPKKRRVAPNCSSKRSSPIAFFAPPDLELFFFFALRNNSTTSASLAYPSSS